MNVKYWLVEPNDLVEFNVECVNVVDVTVQFHDSRGSKNPEEWKVCFIKWLKMSEEVDVF